MSSIDNLKSMVVFAKVVETLSFTEAAKILQLSKSSISREIAQLEVRVGAQLIHRTTRKMEITEVGEKYYHYCAKILDEAKSAEKFIHHLHEDPAGNLSVVAPVSFGTECVVPVLNQLLKENLHLKIDLDLTDRAIDVSDSPYDVAIQISRDAPENPFSIHLADIDWGIFCAPDYLEGANQIETPQALPRHDFILFRGQAHTISLPFRKQKQRAVIDVQSRFRCNNSAAILSTALSGCGIAYLPDYICQKTVNQGQLVRLLPDWEMDVYQVWLVYKSKDSLTRKALFLANALKKQLPTRQV